MKIQNVAGLFYVSMDVCDKDGPVTEIRDSTLSPYHLVKVENISTLPTDAHVFSVLPSTTHLEFEKDDPHDQWDKEFHNIPNGSERQAICPLKRNGVTHSCQVPIQCDKVLERRGGATQLWLPAPSQNIPFDISIVVS